MHGTYCYAYHELNVVIAALCAARERERERERELRVRREGGKFVCSHTLKRYYEMAPSKWRARYRGSKNHKEPNQTTA